MFEPSRATHESRYSPLSRCGFTGASPPLVLTASPSCAGTAPAQQICVHPRSSAVRFLWERRILLGPYLIVLYPASSSKSAPSAGIHLPKSDVFANFAFSAVKRLTPQSTPRAQSIHKLINKATEMTQMTEKAPPVSRLKYIHGLRCRISSANTFTPLSKNIIMNSTKS